MKKNPISKHKGLITSFISRKFSSKNTTNPPPSNEIEPYHFKRDESVNMRRVAMHSVLLDNPNTVESYFRKLAFKQKLKKQKLQEEIKQKKNCNTLLPAFTLNQELKRKWNRIKVRLHMHISFQKTRNEMKLYGIIKNKNNVSG